jgi:hypothetical protein
MEGHMAKKAGKPKKTKNPRLEWHDRFLIIQEKGQPGTEDQIYAIPYSVLAQFKQTGELAEALRGKDLIKDFFHEDKHMRQYAEAVCAVLTKVESMSDGATVAEPFE